MITSSQTLRKRVKMKDAVSGRTNLEGERDISDTERGLK